MQRRCGGLYGDFGRTAGDLMSFSALSGCREIGMSVFDGRRVKI